MRHADGAPLLAGMLAAACARALSSKRCNEPASVLRPPPRMAQQQQPMDEACGHALALACEVESLIERALGTDRDERDRLRIAHAIALGLIDELTELSDGAFAVRSP